MLSPKKSELKELELTFVSLPTFLPDNYLAGCVQRLDSWVSCGFTLSTKPGQKSG